MSGGLDLLIFPKIGLILFVTIFLLSLVWIYRKGSTKTYERTSNLPFDEAESHE